MNRNINLKKKYLKRTKKGTSNSSNRPFHKGVEKYSNKAKTIITGPAGTKYPNRIIYQRTQFAIIIRLIVFPSRTIHQ